MFTKDQREHPNHKLRKLTEIDYDHCWIPRLFWNAQLTGVQESVRPFVKGFIQNIVPLVLYEGGGMWLTGPVGTGKSAIAALLTKVAVAHHFTARFISASRLREAVIRREEAEQDVTVFQKCREVNFLVLDDLSSFDAEAKLFGADEICGLIRNRHDDCKTTIVTTRLSPDEVDDGFRRILTATADTMAKVHVAGKNLRDGKTAAYLRMVEE